VLRGIVSSGVYRPVLLGVDSFSRMSALPLNPPVTPVIFIKAAFSAYSSPSRNRSRSGYYRSPTGCPAVRFADVGATGDGTRATGWSPVSISACLRHFRGLIKLNRRNRWF
jgi:hypothetical protein